MQRVDVLERNFCWGCSVDRMEVNISARAAIHRIARLPIFHLNERIASCTKAFKQCD
jgi:hypothetical protein